MTKETCDILIIGGGIAGLSSAAELASRKVGKIILVEKGYIGSGNSTRNVGRVRSPQLTEMLTKYAIKCRKKILLIPDTLHFNILPHKGGYAWLLYDDEEIRTMTEISVMHNRLGVRTEVLNYNDTLRLLPILKGGNPPVKGCLFSSEDLIIHHDPMVWAYHNNAISLGCTILPKCEVKRIKKVSEVIKGIDTTRGYIEAPIIINAAGPMSSHVNRLAGVPSLTSAYRREAMVTMPIKPLMDCACTYYKPIEGWFNQTMRGEIVAGAVDPNEPPGYNMTSSLGFLSRVSNMIVKKAPVLGQLKIIRCWAGSYDISLDHLPLIGECHELKGFYQLNGWSGRGVLLSPYSSELIADEIDSGNKQVDLMPFDPNRFQELKNTNAKMHKDYYSRYTAKTN